MQHGAFDDVNEMVMDAVMTDITDPLLIQRVNEAKKIEREQHLRTYYQGLNSNFQKFQHYYEQTYGKEASHE